MLKLVIESDESATRRHCGAHVSEDFRRVFGDHDHVARRGTRGWNNGQLGVAGDGSVTVSTTEQSPTSVETGRRDVPARENSRITPDAISQLPNARIHVLTWHPSKRWHAIVCH